MEESSQPINVEGGNRLIAEFMGLTKKEQEWRMPYPTTAFLINDRWHSVKRLQYHTSWDWLMPVVEKIANSSSDHEFIIEMGKTFISSRRRHLDDGRSYHWKDGEPNEKIITVWKTCIEFIQFYNTQKTNQ